jgi:DNA-binding HxlR family transcriptional regulator
MSEGCKEAGDALTQVFGLLGKRWTGMVVGVLLENGSAHFSELHRAIAGISERMLSDRLSELGDAGLVLREVEPGPPLRVTYCLTPRGEALRPALTELLRWAEENLSDPV